MSHQSTRQREEYLARINRVLDYIEEHIDQELSLDKLARIASFSRFHFHRIFRALVGETLHGHMMPSKVEGLILRIRIEKEKAERERRQNESQ